MHELRNGTMKYLKAKAASASRIAAITSSPTPLPQPTQKPPNAITTSALVGSEVLGLMEVGDGESILVV